jgi:hypothetical protein
MTQMVRHFKGSTAGNSLQFGAQEEEEERKSNLDGLTDFEKMS